MPTSAPQTPAEYLASLPEDRRVLLDTVRAHVLGALPDGYEENVDWGMLVYELPLDRYANTYNGRPLLYAALASKKNYCTLHLHGVYADEAARDRFEEAYAATGKTLDMGKACLRFKTLDDLALDVVADSLAAVPPDAYIALYEQSRSTTKKG